MGLVVRTIGLARATVKMRRAVWLTHHRIAQTRLCRGLLRLATRLCGRITRVLRRRSGRSAGPAASLSWILARKTPENLHLWSRNGRDWSAEFAGITAARKARKLQSFLIDGEACACDRLAHFTRSSAAERRVPLRALRLRSPGAGWRRPSELARSVNATPRLARLLADAPEWIHLSDTRMSTIARRCSSTPRGSSRSVGTAAIAPAAA